MTPAQSLWDPITILTRGEEEGFTEDPLGCWFEWRPGQLKRPRLASAGIYRKPWEAARRRGKVRWPFQLARAVPQSSYAHALVELGRPHGLVWGRDWSSRRVHHRMRSARAAGSAGNTGRAGS